MPKVLYGFVRRGGGETQDLVRAVMDIMGLDPCRVGEGDALSQLGIDSMQVVEVRSCLQRALARTFPLDEVNPFSHAVLWLPVQYYWMTFSTHVHVNTCTRACSAPALGVAHSCLWIT